MMATQNIDINDLLRQCEKPFTFEEHGIIKKKDGNIDSVYLLKDAVRRRMSQIDPHWTTGVPQLMGIQGDVVAMTGAMTFLGGQRAAIGTGKITSSKRDDKQNTRVEIEGYELAREVSKAMKSAVSDLLPRLATEWNIGAYLRQMPRAIKTEAEFKGWLAGQMAAWEQRYTTHWASNGKGQLFWQLIKAYGLTWDIVKKELEPGRELAGLREISLSDVEAFTRLVAISLEKAK
jgi:hypothetical protein